MQPTQYADPPVGPDGLIDVFAFATRVPGSPEIRPSGIDLAALDAATPAAPVGPFGLPVAAPAAAADRPKVSDHDLLVAEVANDTSEPDLPEGAVRVGLKDPRGEETVATFVVLHADDWPSSANAWMGDPMRWHDWAMKVLATDDDKDRWATIDPTNRQTSQFINAYLAATGNLPAPKGQR